MKMGRIDRICMVALALSAGACDLNEERAGAGDASTTSARVPSGRSSDASVAAGERDAGARRPAAPATAPRRRAGRPVFTNESLAGFEDAGRLSIVGSAKDRADNLGMPVQSPTRARTAPPPEATGDVTIPGEATPGAPPATTPPAPTAPATATPPATAAPAPPSLQTPAPAATPSPDAVAAPAAPAPATAPEGPPTTERDGYGSSPRSPAWSGVPANPSDRVP